jgi:hypothetical protein
MQCFSGVFISFEVVTGMSLLYSTVTPQILQKVQKVESELAQHRQCY